MSSTLRDRVAMVPQHNQDPRPNPAHTRITPLCHCLIFNIVRSSTLTLMVCKCQGELPLLRTHSAPGCKVPACFSDISPVQSFTNYIAAVVPSPPHYASSLQGSLCYLFFRPVVPMAITNASFFLLDLHCNIKFQAFRKQIHRQNILL